MSRRREWITAAVVVVASLAITGVLLVPFVYINFIKDSVKAEEGTTVPEYMLVLGFISVAIVVAFNTSGMSTAIGALSSNLITKITP